MTVATLEPNEIASLAAVLLLVPVHLFAGELRRLGANAQRVVIAFGSGASLTYVLLNMLPKLAEKQEALLASTERGVLGFLQHHAYLVALIGLVAYYAIARISYYGTAGEARYAPVRHPVAVVATAVGYAAYSLLIGYLVVKRIDFGLVSLVLITGALGMLFLVTDHGLHKQWPNDYDRWLRWVLTLALLAGWALAVFVDVSSNVLTLWYAFLAGVMLISTIKEKLAIEEPGTLTPFLIGVAAFALVILALRVSSEANV